MKKLLLSAALLPVVSFGQITLNNTHFPVAGDQLILSTSTDFTLDYTSTGANHTWDFSNLTASDQRFTDCRPMSQASQLSSLFFGSFAPAAYKASYFSPVTDLPLDQLTAGSPISIDQISQFSKSATAALTLVGFEFIISGQGIPAKSDTIETRYAFPLNYGNSYNSHGYTKLDMNPIYDAQWIQHRYHEAEVDGWGSITTPYGTFNALRIHHRVIESDSLYISFNGTGTWIGIPVPEAHEYEWRAAEEREAILRVRTSVIAGTEQPTAVEYRDQYNGLGLPENQVNFAVYPNPVTSDLSVVSTVNMEKIVVLDQQGKIVQSLQGGGMTATANVSGLDAGVYQVVVYTQSGVKTNLFVKQ